MKRLLTICFAVLVAVGLTATVALAAVNVKSEPTISFSGASATVSGGNFSGLGNIDATGILTVTGVANYQCRNNGASENVVPGQNPVDAGTGTSPATPIVAEKNGRATVPLITASLTAPPTPSPQDVGCGGKGSNNWTVELISLTATAAHFEVEWSGDIVFCRNYTLGGSATGTAC
jgi:hypothetical protein